MQTTLSKITYGFYGVVLLWVLLQAYYLSGINYLVFHTLAELISTLLCFSIFMKDRQ